MAQQVDIAVVGGGLVGCCCACLFAQQGFSVALISAGPLPTWQAEQPATRVSAINLAVVRMLQALDVWPDVVQKRVSPYQRMSVWEHDSTATIDFNAVDLGQAYLGYIVENAALSTSLVHKLQHNYAVTLLPHTRLVAFTPHAHGVELQLDGAECLHARLLVGADGAQSRVRQLLPIDAPRRAFNQDAITCVVETAKPHRQTAWQCFQPTGPVALLPLANGDCSLVWSCAQPRAAELMALSATAFAAELQCLFAPHLGELNTPYPRSRVALQQLHAARYIHTASALVGDAAHVIHPLAGLGANLGLVDAAALAEVVGAAKAAHKPFNSQPVLRRYERWRRGDNALMVSVTAGFKAGFGSRQPLLQTARRCGLKLVDRLAPLKHELARFACGLSGDLPKLCRALPGTPPPGSGV